MSLKKIFLLGFFSSSLFAQCSGDMNAGCSQVLALSHAIWPGSDGRVTFNNAGFGAGDPAFTFHSAPGTMLYVTKDFPSTSGQDISGGVFSIGVSSSDTLNRLVALAGSMSWAGNGTANQVRGVDAYADSNGPQAGATSVRAVSAEADNNDNAAVQQVIGIYSSVNNNFTGTVRGLWGLFVDTPNINGYVGAAYGIQVFDITGAADNYAIKTGSGKIEFGDVLHAQGYKSGDGSAGVTVNTCTSFKDGLCVAGS